MVRDYGRAAPSSPKLGYDMELLETGRQKLLQEYMECKYPRGGLVI